MLCADADVDHQAGDVQFLEKMKQVSGVGFDVIFGLDANSAEKQIAGLDLDGDVAIFAQEFV